jgi:hypothetical protein
MIRFKNEKTPQRADVRRASRRWPMLATRDRRASSLKNFKKYTRARRASRDE